ncbi:MAG TPA: 5-(carboxyamino)imidazole ribonucleotide mutase [Mycobacteriales bacterium]|jgi:5-(carboxyamino)imidazole ribonucleotide mutase|nr:5-(carboxyamino)imidazole ribonucleotide mutase [Mycobacteriales bacterium]
MSTRPRVAIVSGSPSDGNVMSQVGAMLDRFEVPWDEAVLSAHRAPKALASWIDDLEPRGIEVVIAGAGMAAALPGTVAAHTTLPVIGVPIRGGALDGLDALLAIAQMPPGVPVATVGLNGAKNAAVLAVQILAIGDPDLRAKLAQFKDDFEKAALNR